MKKLIRDIRELYVCDRCGKEFDETGRITEPMKVSFDLDSWSYVWDGKSYRNDDNPERRRFEWKRLRRMITIELCEDCENKFKEFWTDSVLGEQIKTTIEDK